MLSQSFKTMFIFFFILILASSYIFYPAQFYPAQAEPAYHSLTFKNASGSTIKTFTVQELKKLFPQKSYKTEPPPWNGTPFVFRGPSIKDVMDKLGIAQNSTLKVTAYDGYASRIHPKEIQTYDPILAIETECTKQDYASNICHKNQQFKPLTLLDKGPIRIIWPYEQFPSGSFPLLNPIWIYSIAMIQVI